MFELVKFARYSWTKSASNFLGTAPGSTLCIYPSQIDDGIHITFSEAEWNGDRARAGRRILTAAQNESLLRSITGLQRGIRETSTRGR